MEKETEYYIKLQESLGETFSDEEINHIDRKIKELKKSGDWGEMDIFYDFASPTEKTAKINWAVSSKIKTSFNPEDIGKI